MPLRPTIVGTNAVKAIDDYSEEELRHHIDQIFDEQLIQVQAKRPLDTRALDDAEKRAKKLHDSALNDRLASLRAYIADGPKIQEPPRGQQQAR